MDQTEKEKKLVEEFCRLLPGVTIVPLRRGNEDEVDFSHFCIPAENKYLQKSAYFYTGKPSFIHYTNLSALQSIITEKNIRLYNLQNLDDPNEYSFAGSLIKYNHENKEDAKNNMYLLSMCQTELFKQQNSDVEFNMWRLYGGNGYGAALELNFDQSNQAMWENYFLSAVRYGSDSETKFKEISQLLESLQNLHPSVSVDLGQLVCFHKSEHFRLEKETRLLFDDREKNFQRASIFTDKDGERISPIIRPDILKSSQGSEKVKYLALPIYHAKFTPISRDNGIPVPKINKIILGFQYKDDAFKAMSDNLTELCHSCLGYVPSIEKSRLTKSYHERI